MKIELRELRWTSTQEVSVLAGMWVLIFLLTRVGWVDGVLSGTHIALVPLAKAIPASIQFVEQPFFSFNHMYSSAAELSIVKEKYAISLAELAELESLKLENQQLRQMMENRHLSLEKRVIAVPVASYAYPAISAGASDGVAEGGLVVVADTLLGRVSSSHDTESRVELLSSQEAQPVLAQTESGVQGLVQGTGRGVVLTQIPPDAVVEIGERVVSMGQPGIKAGLFLGIVTVEQGQPTSPIKTVGLDQLVSFYTTPLVEVW